MKLSNIKLFLTVSVFLISCGQVDFYQTKNPNSEDIPNPGLGQLNGEIEEA